VDVTYVVIAVCMQCVFACLCVLRWLMYAQGCAACRTQINTYIGQKINVAFKRAIYMYETLSNSGSTVLLLDLGRLFSFLILYTVGRTPWTADQPIARPLPTQRTTKKQNKCTQTSTPRVGFEPTILVFQRAKAVHAVDRASTVIGEALSYSDLWRE
jgi:hypothetical protein